MHTPEGKVKKHLRTLLDDYDIYYFMPATGGYGRSGLPDIVGCVHGCFFAVECKAPGKEGNLTGLQQLELEAIEKAGGVAFVYAGPAHMPDEEVLRRILEGGWG